MSKRRAAFEWLIFFIPVIVIATILHDYAPLLLPDQKIEQDRDGVGPQPRRGSTDYFV